MALEGFIQDLAVFIRERAAQFDETLDVSEGSPFDSRVIQPILRRVGSDPFSIDVEAFIQDRLNQEFPTLVTKAGDALTDLLIKPFRLLVDPVVRENARIKNALSFKDPSTLTTEEADALGANLFAQREKGNLSRGSSRIYFSSPQNVVISPANFVKSKAGLRFFPDSTQSIRVDEMLLNVEGSLYYFDITVVAENAGDEYNLGPDELVSIANLTQAVRVTNKRRFRFGAPAEDAVAFAARAEGELTERSLVTDRGIQAVLTKTFPDITRLAVVGMNDPEMDRDVIEGGALGPIEGAGLLATPVSDGEAKRFSRRVTVSPAENPQFLAKIGSVGNVSGWVITLFSALPTGSVPSVRDFNVRAVVDDRTLDVAEQVFEYGTPGTGPWMLRRKNLTLSKIPGGILFPDGPTGTITVPDDRVHIGGCTDIYLRGVDLDQSVLELENLTDGSPVLSGILGETALGGVFKINDLVLGVSYQENDETYVALKTAVETGCALRILAGAVAGTYSILSVIQTPGSSPQIVLRSPPATLLTNLRWQLLDVIDVELLEPKQVKLEGKDAKTVLALDLVETGSATNLNAFGVSVGDTFRLLEGPDAGDYEIKAITGLFNTQVQLSSAMTRTKSNLRFMIFKPNVDGGLKLPFVRVSSVDLLDTSGQPVGMKVPYARPVGILSESFANTGNGVKTTVTDGSLGLVGAVLPLALVFGSSTPLKIRTNCTAVAPLGTLLTVNFSAGSYSPQQVVDKINLAAGTVLAVLLPEGNLGLLPLNGTTKVLVVDNTVGALTAFMGSSTDRTSRDVRSVSISALVGGWGSTTIAPPIDPLLDVLQVIDGTQIGFYPAPKVATADVLVSDHEFAPELGRTLQVGARSLGTSRIFFLEPTSAEIGPNTRFKVTQPDGQVLGFIPDPTNQSQKIPALPAANKPVDGRAMSGSVFRSPSTDFVKKGIQVGDVLAIDFLPLIGSVALPDPVPTLHGKNLVISVEGRADQTITFVNDTAAIAPTSVTRKGVADQINAQVGRKIAKINAANKLEIEATFALTLKTTGTANTLLGFGGLSGPLKNESPNKFDFPILALSTTTPTDVTVDTSTRTLVLVLAGDLAAHSDITRQQFKVLRPHTQRISVSEMSAQVAEAGLYYWDVQLMSEGTGNTYNIADRSEMTVEGLKADGYWLTTDDPNLSFSTVEKPRMHLSRSILPTGVNDDPMNALELSGQNIQVTYDRSSLVANVQAFVSAEAERVTNNSPLVRHLTPYFVRVDLVYTGGKKERDISPLLETYVQELAPNERLESSDLQKILSDNGATSIQNPLELLAVVHKTDRTIVLERSQDGLNTGRLAAFIPDAISLSRKVS